MRKTPWALVAMLLAGCATSAADRRMHDSYGDTASTYATTTPEQAGVALAVAAMLLQASGPRALSTQPPTDYAWAWDLQRAPNGGLIWVCRGIQSGQYADQAKCAYKLQADTQWPGY
jgi:hypothetical protein